MTARKANPKPKVGITINHAKAIHTVQASQPVDAPQRVQTLTAAPRPTVARTDDLFKRPVYTPCANTYQRNTGHPHIASHGVQC